MKSNDERIMPKDELYYFSVKSSSILFIPHPSARIPS